MPTRRLERWTTLSGWLRWRVSHEVEDSRSASGGSTMRSNSIGHFSRSSELMVGIAALLLRDAVLRVVTQEKLSESVEFLCRFSESANSEIPKIGMWRAALFRKSEFHTSRSRARFTVCQSGIFFVLMPCLVAMHFQTSTSAIRRLTLAVLGMLPFGHWSFTNSKMAFCRGGRWRSAGGASGCGPAHCVPTGGSAIRSNASSRLDEKARALPLSQFLVSDGRARFAGNTSFF